jgi:large subunit ribosomal protein L10
MTRVEKAEIVESLSTTFKESTAIVVCDYRGLAVNELEDLRNKIRELGGKVKVVKNTLATLALQGAGKEGMTLKDTNIFVWGEDTLALTKAIAKMTETYKDKLVIKQGHIDGECVSGEHIVALSKLPSKEELIGMLLSVWTAPVRGMVTGLDNLAKQKESEAA